MIESSLVLLNIIKLDSNRVCSGKYILGIALFVLQLKGYLVVAEVFILRRSLRTQLHPKDD